MFHNEGKNVETGEGIILWDSVTQPDTDERTGQPVHSLKIAIPANAAEKLELEQLATTTLQNSDFKGQFPAGGNWPIMDIDMQKMAADAALLQGRVAISAKTRLGVPPIHDLNGQELGAMQYGRMLYPGAVVKLLVHCYAFNNKSKGLAFGLDGIQIVDATTPKLSVGGGMSSAQVGAIWGGGGAPVTAGPPVTQGPPVTAGPPAQPHPGFVENAATAGIPAAAAPVHQMTASANGATYEAMIAAGWTDETMIQHGHMLP